MKKSVLILALMLATGSAYATPLVDNSVNSSATASAAANALQSQSQNAYGGAGGAGGKGGAGGVGVGIGGTGIGGVGVGGSVGDTTLNSSTNVEAGDYGDLKIVPPAIAPSVGNNVICPMVIQGSKALSIFLISVSGTHGADLVPICIAHHLGQRDVVEKMTCNASKEYAKANPNCAK